MKVSIRVFLFSLFLSLAGMGFSQTSSENTDSSSYDVAPEVINLEEFSRKLYPERAKQTNIEGKVVINAFVNSKGRIEKYHILKDPSPILTKAVTSRIKKLKFKPAIENGEKIAVWIKLPFDFKLDK